MHYLQIIFLAVVQGLAELLPVSSSAHVIFAERMMGLDPTTPEMTFLLVMLHTGTMGAVILYFWPRWKRFVFSANERNTVAKQVIAATLVTGIIGYALKHLIEKIFLQGDDIEALFGNHKLIAFSLASAGVLILVAGTRRWISDEAKNSSLPIAAVVGAVQGLCLPFRGFSRSGATISTGLIAGWTKEFAEEFSFILAVILTPPVILKELHRLVKANSVAHISYSQLLLPGFLGMVFSFAAGYLAILWLSAWLEKGNWRYFGFYCLVFAAVTYFS